MQQKKVRPLATVRENRCVACGCCEQVCPKQAIQVAYGIKALVNPARCIGCGLCAKACPASVITMEVAQ